MGNLPMRTFLINLDSATARLSAAQIQLTLLSLPFERISAVRGSNLTGSQKTELYSQPLNTKYYFQPMSDGEIGCYASHLHVWKLAQDRQLPYCLVLEDDLTVSNQLPAALHAIEQLPIGWDVIRLNTRAKESALATRPLIEGIDLIRFNRVPSRTTAYVISSQGINKLLKKLPPIYRPIDIDMRYFWEFNLDMMGVSPALVTESALSLQSTIDRPANHAKQLRGAKHRWGKLIEQARYTVANHKAKTEQFPW
jgi:glycosyl transferase, family 25